MTQASGLTRLAVQDGVTAALELDGDSVTDALAVSGWEYDDADATGLVTFGPYPSRVTASGVVTYVAGEAGVDLFESELSLPAGMSVVCSVTIRVTDG